MNKLCGTTSGAPRFISPKQQPNDASPLGVAAMALLLMREVCVHSALPLLGRGPGQDTEGGGLNTGVCENSDRRHKERYIVIYTDLEGSLGINRDM